MFKNDNYYMASKQQIIDKRQKQKQEEIKQREAKIKKDQQILAKQPQSTYALKILASRKKQQSLKRQAQIQAELAFLNSQEDDVTLSLTFSSARKENPYGLTDDQKSFLQSTKRKKLSKSQQHVEVPSIKEAFKPEFTQFDEIKEQKLEMTNSKSYKEVKSQKVNDDDDFDELIKASFKSDPVAENKSGAISQKKTENTPEQTTLKQSKPVSNPFSKISVFKPKSTLKLVEIPQEKEKQKEKIKSRDQLERERRKQDKKMKAQFEKLQKGSRTQKNQKEDQKKNQENDGQKKQKKSGKKIKKAMNYQALDLKRRYKDKFVGGMRDNQRKYTKNGVLKPQFRINRELEVQDGEVNNIYAHSLSSSFFVRINLDSESDSEEEEKPVEIPTVEESTQQRLTSLIQDMFGFEQFRQGQFEVIRNVLHHNSTIFVSQTASGKSLTYIISSIIMAKQFQGMSIVISPLIALMLDQLDHLPLELPAACISSLINYEQRAHILTMIKQKKVKLLFITPEMLMTDILFHLKQFPPINFLCVDEAHCLSELSHNFRTSYIALSQIITKHIKYNTPDNKPNILCLTATANTETIQSLSKKLSINQIIKSSSTLNKNLYITISREIGQQKKYRSLVQYLETPEIQRCQATLIYCRAKYIQDNVWNFLSNSGIPATVFHGGLEHKQKTRIITQFKNKNIKIIISTTALGMGLDFQHLDCIVHFNMAKSLESYVQEIGRAGRRQNRAYCHLFLDESDFLIERNYILADQLEDHSMKVISEQIDKSQNYTKQKNHAKNQKKSQKSKKKEEIKPSLEEMERVVNRAAMAIEKMEKQEEQSEDFEYLFEDSKGKEEEAEKEEENQDNQDSSGFSQLYWINVKELAEKTTLREQALFIILMKTAELLNNHLTNNSGDEILRILPLSHEILKLSFFKSNEKDLCQNEAHGEFYRQLVDMEDPKSLKTNCKKVNGTYQIPLIEKCNKLKMSPIQLMSKVYEISNEYTMKVEFLNEVYVFSIDQGKGVKRSKVNTILKDKDFHKSVIELVNQIQNMSMKKLEVFYSLAFNHSQITVDKMLEKRLIISRSTPLPPKNIMDEITKYFNMDINSFYSYLAQTDDELQREMFLPTQTIQDDEKNNIFEHIKLFFKHMYSNLRDNNNKMEVIKRKEALIDTYQDGKIITRVFLGVNDEKSSRMIYGEHSYWRMFIKKKYFCLLKMVRELIHDYRDKLLEI